MGRLTHWSYFGVASFVAAGFLFSTSTAVFAQGALPSEQLMVEEITVIARKREENIQDVGFSVSAMGQQEILNNYSTDIRDLVSISPNLLIDDTAQGPGGVASVYIRGIGVSEVENIYRRKDP